VDQAGEAVKELLTSRGLQVSLEHTVIPNPNGEGNVQEFRVEGAALQIAKVEFSDPSFWPPKPCTTSIRDTGKALFPNDHRSLPLRSDKAHLSAAGILACEARAAGGAADG